jgi:GT2 family glycosyltransferase/8-oxo-dGTP pyrophosphatase MutT (NUDIX family)
MPKLSVNLVTWNGSKYIPYLFESLKKQTFKDWKLFVFDNGSTDNTVDAIKKELADFNFDYEIIKNKENFGFAGGHNRIFKLADTKYVLLLNQDMYIKDDCIEKMIAYADLHKDVSAIAPRLMKWNFDEININGLQASFSGLVDALGLKIYRSRRVIEQFTSEEWTNIKDAYSADVLPVFGVSGAFPMFKRKVLEEVADVEGNIFDENYHAYKEDVDLAFRLRSAGHCASVLLDAVSYHDRSAAGPKDLSDNSAIKNKRNQSQWVKYNSYKNHLMTLYKNEYFVNFIIDFPWILWYEIKKFIFFLIFDRKVLTGCIDILRKRKELACARHNVILKRKINWIEMRRWWSGCNFEKHISCGLIPLRKDLDGIKVLLVKQKKNGCWSFPKGHVEQNEKSEKTAVRELFEETGLVVDENELIDKYDTKYSFELNGKIINKKAVFFICWPKEFEVLIKMPEEISSAEWFNLKNAKDRLGEKNLVKIIMDVEEKIKNS